MAEHGGYESGHVWYYFLGGRILTVEEIRRDCEESARRNGLRDYLQDYAETFNRMDEPKRSTKMAEERKRLAQAIEAEREAYAEYAERVTYRRRFLGPWADQDRDIWSEPNQGLSLIHNHLCYSFFHEIALDTVAQEQLSLF